MATNYLLKKSALKLPAYWIPIKRQKLKSFVKVSSESKSILYQNGVVVSPSKLFTIGYHLVQNEIEKNNSDWDKYIDHIILQCTKDRKRLNKKRVTTPFLNNEILTSHQTIGLLYILSRGCCYFKNDVTTESTKVANALGLLVLTLNDTNYVFDSVDILRILQSINTILNSLSLSEQQLATSSIEVTDQQKSSTISLKTIIDGTIRFLLTKLPGYTSNELIVPLICELAKLGIYVPRLFKHVRNLISTDSIHEITTDDLLRVLNVWKSFHISNDFLVIFNIARQFIYKRIDMKMKPRQIMKFIELISDQNINYQYVFDHCFIRLFRFHSSEISDIEYNVNRMFGTIPNQKNGRWFAKQSDDMSVNFRIGSEESTVFVGSHYTLECRRESEMKEKETYLNYLRSQFTMDPQETLNASPTTTTTINDIAYPLFASEQFERLEQNNDRKEKMLECLKTLTHPEETPAHYLQILADMIRGLNKINYIEESLVRCVAYLIGEGDTMKHKEKSVDYCKVIGTRLLNEWDFNVLIEISTLCMVKEVYVPKYIITKLTQEIFYAFKLLNCSQIERLLENMAHTTTGIYRGFFVYPVPQNTLNLLSLPEHVIWELSPLALGHLLLILSNHCDASILCDSEVIGWAVDSYVQMIIEALTQKLHLSLTYNGGRPKYYKLPLLTNRIVKDFTWAASSLDTLAQNNSIKMAKTSDLSSSVFEHLSNLRTPHVSKKKSSRDIHLENLGIQDEEDDNNSEPPEYKAFSFLEDNCPFGTHQEIDTHQDTPVCITSNRQFDSPQTYYNPSQINGLQATFDTLKEFVDKSNEVMMHVDPSSSLDSAAAAAANRQGDQSCVPSLVTSQHYNLSKLFASQANQVGFVGILAYLLLSDVWSISSRKDHRCSSGIDVSVLDWEEGLRAKLQKMPLKSVSLIHDILTICSTQNNEDKEIEKKIQEDSMFSELEANPELRRLIQKYIRQYWYEGLEARHLCHPSILTFVNENIKQHKMPPLPSHLQRAQRFARTTHPPQKTGDEGLSSPMEEVNDDDDIQESDCAQSLKNNKEWSQRSYDSILDLSVYHLLNQNLKPFHDLLGCTRLNGVYNEAVQIHKSQLLAGAFRLDLVLRKVK